MSIADHFHHAPDAAFVRNYDSGAARRQFRLSLMLLAVIVLAATALGAVVRFDGPSGFSTPSAPAVAPPAYVGKL